MPRKSKQNHDKTSPAIEPEWYTTPAGRRETQREFERALRAGTLVRSTRLPVRRTDPGVLQALLEKAKESATRPVSIRIPIVDLERAKEIAARRGRGYQAVLKEAIRDGLKRAG